MANIKLDLSNYFTDLRSFSLFPVEQNSHPTVGSVVEAVTLMFNLTCDGSASEKVALFHEDFYIHPFLPSNLLLNLSGIFRLQPIKDKAADGYQKSPPQCLLLEKGKNGRIDDKENNEIHKNKSSEVLPALHLDTSADHGKDLGVQHSEAFNSSVERESVIWARTKKRKIHGNKDTMFPQPVSKRVKVQKITGGPQQYIEEDSAQQIEIKKKSDAGRSSSLTQDASRKRKKMKNDELGQCSNKLTEECDDSVEHSPSLRHGLQVSCDSLCNNSLGSNLQSSRESLEHDPENLFASYSTIKNSERCKKRHELMMPSAPRRDSAGSDVLRTRQQEPVEIVGFSCSPLESDTATRHGDSRESSRKDAEKTTSDEDSAEVICKPKSRRRRKHNKRVRKEKQRLRQFVCGDDESLLNEQQLTIADQVVSSIEQKYLGRGTRLLSTADRLKIRSEYERELAAFCGGSFELSKFLTSDGFFKWIDSCSVSSRQNEANRSSIQKEKTELTPEHHSAFSRANDNTKTDAVQLVASGEEHVEYFDCHLSSQSCSKQSKKVKNKNINMECNTYVTSTPVCGSRNSSANHNRLFGCTDLSRSRDQSGEVFDLEKFRNYVEECAKHYRSSDGSQNFSLLNDMSNGELLTYSYERKKLKTTDPGKDFIESKTKNSKKDISSIDQDNEASLLPIDERSKYPFREPPAPSKFPALCDQVKSNFFFLSCMEEAPEPLVYYRSDRKLATSEPGRCEESHVSGSERWGVVPETVIDDKTASMKAQFPYDYQDYQQKVKPLLMSSRHSQAPDIHSKAEVLGENNSTQKLPNSDAAGDDEQSSVVHEYGSDQRVVEFATVEKSETRFDHNASSVANSLEDCMLHTPVYERANNLPKGNSSNLVNPEPAAEDGRILGISSTTKDSGTTVAFDGSSQSSMVHVHSSSEGNCKAKEPISNQSLSSHLEPATMASTQSQLVNSGHCDGSLTPKTNELCCNDATRTVDNILNVTNEHERSLLIRQVKLEKDVNEGSPNVVSTVTDVTSFDSSSGTVVRDQMQSAEDVCARATSINRSKKYKPRVHSAVGSLLQMLRNKDRANGPEVGTAQMCDVEPKSEFSLANSNSDGHVNSETKGTRNKFDSSGRCEKDGTIVHKSDTMRQKRVRKRNRKTPSSTHEFDCSSGASSLWDAPPVELRAAVESCNTRPGVEPSQPFTELNINSFPPLKTAPRVNDVIFFFEKKKANGPGALIKEKSTNSAPDVSSSRETSEAVSENATSHLKTRKESLQNSESSPVVGRIVTAQNGDLMLSTIETRPSCDDDASQTEKEIVITANGGSTMRSVKWSDVLQPRLIFP